MQDVFHSEGTLPSRRLRLKTCCRGSPSSSAQAFSSLEETPSGPAAFLRLSLRSSVRTWSAVITGGIGRDAEVDRAVPTGAE